MKEFNRIIITLSVIALVTPLSYARKKAVGEDISNMIIQGENRLQVHGAVPELPWQVDAYKDVPESLRDYVLLGELKSPSITQPPLTLPVRSTSQKAASPWINEIIESPVLTMSFKPEKEIPKPKWIFVVRDSQGKPFFEINKLGKIPEKISWMGFSNSGSPLHVGFDYSYLMTIIDEAGNPKRYAGRPFRLNSFRYIRSGRTVTLFSPDALFADRASIKFSDVGRSNLTEMKDYLRTRYGEKIEVIVYDDDLKFAKSRAKAVRDYLVRSLDFPDSQVSANGLSLSQGEGYKHAEIITK